MISNNLGPIVGNSSFFKNRLSQYSNCMSIGHLNCHSLRPSIYNTTLCELKNLICDSGFGLFAVSETWLKPYVSSKTVAIPGYSFVRNDRPSARGGGVGIYILKNIKYKVVFRSENPGVCESLFIELIFGLSKVLFGVVYLPHGNIHNFEEIHEDILSRYESIIVVGDFNCNLFDISKSSEMRNVCLRLGISITHNSLPTHFNIATDSVSLIDFFACSHLCSLISSDQVQCPSISHHSLIFGITNINLTSAEHFFEFRNYNDINWDGLLDYLVNVDFSSLYSTSDINLQLSFLQLLIANLFSYVPIVRKRVVHSLDPWLKCKSIILAISLRDMAYKNYLKFPTLQNMAVYRTLRNKAKSILRKERKKYYEQIFNGLNATHLWRQLHAGGIVDNDVNLSTDFDVNVLNEYFTQENGVGNVIVDFPDIDRQCHTFSFNCVFEIDVFEAFQQVKSKSVGVDGVPIKFLKLIYPYISRHFTYIFNTMFTTSTFPNDWKIARVFPISKNKGRNTIENLRPISILPSLSKVAEHLIRLQIQSFIDDNKFLINYQYGFRRGLSTTSLLVDLTDLIRETIDGRDSGVLVALDISKAFDCVDHSMLIEKLFSLYAFDSNSCKLIASYLSGRSQYVSYNGEASSLRNIYSGVPQGSILGPLLFVLYVNDISSILTNCDCHPFMYADDIHLFFKGQSDFQLENTINTTLGNISRWLRNNNLVVNVSKTKAMTFGSPCRLNSGINIQVNGVAVDFVDRINCLGVVLDAKLDFSLHIDALYPKVINMLRKLHSTDFYLPLFVKRNLAHSMLFSVISYCIEVISGTTHEYLMKLEKLFNIIVRYVYNLRRFDHISAHAVLFLGVSFSTFVKQRVVSFLYKCICLNLPGFQRDRLVFSRSTRNTQIIFPHFSTSLYERSFIVRSARIWNQLPAELRQFSFSRGVFRRMFENFVEANGG